MYSGEDVNEERTKGIYRGEGVYGRGQKEIIIAREWMGR